MLGLVIFFLQRIQTYNNIFFGGGGNGGGGEVVWLW